MIRFTTYQLFKNKWLWLWPVVSIGFALVLGIWGDVQSAHNGYSFMIRLGHTRFPSGLLVPEIIFVSVLIAVITAPTHFSHNIESGRASLLLSKAVSRTEFLLADFAGALIMAIAYTLITIFALILMLLLNAGIFPVGLFFALLIFIPLYFFAYYLSISLFLLFTGSQLASILLGYFLMGFLSNLFFHADKFLAALGYAHSAWSTLANVLSYVIPCTSGIQQMTRELLIGGFANFDVGLFLLILVSFLPVGLLSFYLIHRKQF